MSDDKKSYKSFSIPSPLPYDDAVFIAHAVKDKLISSEEKADTFRAGHYKGIEAIHCHYYLKIKKPIPNINKNTQNISENELINLRCGRHNGKKLDDIVLSISKNLGLALCLKEAIKTKASREKILSFNCEYTLPLYYESDFAINEDEKRHYMNLYASHGKDCHTREEILDLFESKVENFEKAKIDTIIVSLIRDGYI
jgi:hypothetical protein